MGERGEKGDWGTGTGAFICFASTFFEHFLKVLFISKVLNFCNAMYNVIKTIFICSKLFLFVQILNFFFRVWFKKMMAWSELGAVEKVFHNVTIVREVGSYLGLQDTLALLESKIGRVEEAVRGKKMKERRLARLVSSLSGGGGGREMVLKGSETFDHCQREISNYMQIVALLRGDGGEEMKEDMQKLYDALVGIFPVLLILQFLN